MIASKYPVDIEALAKGSAIPAEYLEDAYGMRRETDAFRLKLLALKEKIESEKAGRGEPVTVVAERGGLRILTDSEAATYNPQRFRAGLSAARRSHSRTMAVDAENLTSDERAALDGSIIFQSRVLLGIALGAKNKLPSPSPPRALGIVRDPS